MVQVGGRGEQNAPETLQNKQIQIAAGGCSCHCLDSGGLRATALPLPRSTLHWAYLPFLSLHHYLTDVVPNFATTNTLTCT
ncbi:hypothetical protein E2C01_013434 [Portunus trituberculatus]|uniref:Uncharacterized protein n=1 Tax=Portunus trituberculatus TaxID=210409 RepID=A0A5B7DH33_PORTR|nr:hypothetical protein [Portunus trituberculatus]